MMHGLQNLIGELEQDCSLNEPDRLRQRIDALDRLDAYLDGQLDGPLPAIITQSIAPEIYPRAKALYVRLEQANSELYQTIRLEIQRSAERYELLQRLASQSNQSDNTTSPTVGEGYDYLDELVSGVLQFEEPSTDIAQLPAEMVFYQPTPARHIFDLIHRVALTERDVLIDLGSGMGHVPLLAAICTSARSIGIELEAAYVDCARQSAQALNLNNVAFIQQDARTADLSTGTVFYLYTPFIGMILRTVLDSLRREAATRPIRICTFGPCTAIIAEEPWLEAVGPLETHRLAIFRSRN
ncbi:histone methylation protein DOT1 [Edaphobacter aggregans]|uniref:Histone methylation protein DOT1 n=1 Tax=Edaphobacter aggregans TaxID=570835 RepID=A0A428MFV5_9BACT|nr:class I SAM-dependent methyltransferase [Edaphobacter aggregans]RSL15732.1 histone methylation protein DOT1 [Edaphobacter aggregans]